jgi:hypothetical protein
MKGGGGSIGASSFHPFMVLALVALKMGRCETHRRPISARLIPPTPKDILPAVSTNGFRKRGGVKPTIAPFQLIYSLNTGGGSNYLNLVY